METSSNGNSFADALARAKQIAAKIGGNLAPPTDSSLPAKRPFDGVSDSQPDAKKLATQDHITAQLRSIADQQRASQAAAAAAAAASQINAKLGITSTTPAAVPAVPSADMSSVLGFGVPQTDNITVPDRMVGFLIGKGGEQIAAIQSETQCMVQFATDSGGMPDRVCTLTGTPSAIEKAKDVISRLVTKFRGGGGAIGGGGSTTGSDEGSGMIELLVPGGKVGLIIGKGGETIKQLMESTGTKIVVIQDSNAPSHNDKPVHITGDRMSCQRAKEKIMDLLADKDIQSFGSSSGGRGFKITQEIPIPRTLIGVIIGKGGEMIKKIQEESGSRVQFKPEDDAGGPMRICTITGNEEGNSLASGMIRDLIENGMQRQNDMGGGRGHGRGQGEGGYGGDWSGQGGPGATNYGVPAEKCGLVIGKGGETIREINRISGAHVEMDRNSNQNPHERIFRVQGNPDQVQAAIRMINEKAGIQQGGGSSSGSQDGHGYGGGPMGGGSMGGGPMGGGSMGGGGPMGGGPMGGGPMNSGHGGPMMGPYGQTNQSGPSQHMQGGPGQMGMMGGNQPGGMMGGGQMGPRGGPQGGMMQGGGMMGPQGGMMSGGPQQQQQQQPQQQSWGNPYGQQQQPQQQQPQQQPQQQQQQQPQQQYGQQTASSDPSKQAAAGNGDPNAAAWAAYYGQYYGGGQQSPPQQTPQQQQPQQQQQQPMGYGAQSAAGSGGGAQSQNQPQPTVNPQTGQLDYSAAWAEYYRQQGMFQHAAAIMQTMGGQGGQQQQQQQQQQQ